jgi:hypothetical protein
MWLVRTLFSVGALSFILLSIFIAISQPSPEIPAPQARQAFNAEPLLHHHTKIVGGDYRKWNTDTVQDCKNLCSSEIECIAWTWEEGTRYCWLKNMLVTPDHVFVDHFNSHSGVFNHRIVKNVTCKNPQPLEVERNQDIKVFIVGLAHQTSGASAKHMAKVAEFLGNLFQDYRIVIFANDPSYVVQRELFEIAAQNPKFFLQTGVNHIQSADGDCGQFQLLAHYRNKILDFVEEYQNDSFIQQYSNGFKADYLIHIEMDLLGSKILDEDKLRNVVKVFKSRIARFGPSQLDVICASAISANPQRTTDRQRVGMTRYSAPTYFDANSLKICDAAYYSKIWNAEVVMVGTLAKRLPHGEDLIGVRSCFGGFAFYRMEALKESQCRYSKKENCYREHIPFNACLSQKGFDAIYVDQQMKFSR